MATIVLGNTAPVEPRKLDPTTDAVEIIPRPELGNTVTFFEKDGPFELVELLALTKTYRSHHSEEPAAWVESDDKEAAKVIAGVFGCPTKRPKAWA